MNVPDLHRTGHGLVLRWVFAFPRMLSDAAAVLAAGIIVYIVLHFLLEMALRALFSTSSFALSEMVSYAVGAATFLALGHAFQRNALVRVQLARTALAKLPRARYLLELVCLGLTAGCGAFVSWFLAQSVLRNYAMGATSYSTIQMPLWIPEAVLLFGIVVFTLQVIAILLETVLLGPSALEGPPGTDTEARRA